MFRPLALILVLSIIIHCTSNGNNNGLFTHVSNSMHYKIKTLGHYEPAKLINSHNPGSMTESRMMHAGIPFYKEGLGTDTLNKTDRRILFFSSSAVLYSGSMLALGSTWYSKYEHSSFHWFNDNKEWLQMDKAGHAVSSWKLNTVLYEGFMYSGYSKKKSLLCSYIASNVAMASIELFDGFSAKWGASYGDLLFNFGGSSLFTAQKMWLNKTWLIPKFSFHQTDFADIYPDALGNNFAENVLKDYNGQTYWLAIPLKRVHSSLPEWLCLSVGYGAEGMVNATLDGVWTDLMTYYSFERYRQYYLSMDINLGGIKTKSTFLRMCFNTFNIIRIPFPALEFSRGKLHGHFLYF